MNNKAKIFLKIISVLIPITIIGIWILIMINLFGISVSNSNEKSRVEKPYNYTDCVNKGWEVKWSYPKSCYINWEIYYENKTVNFDEKNKPIPPINEDDIIEDINNINGNIVVESIDNIDIITPEQ